jgi:hypothetical protein
MSGSRTVSSLDPFLYTNRISYTAEGFLVWFGPFSQFPDPFGRDINQGESITHLFQTVFHSDSCHECPPSPVLMLDEVSVNQIPVIGFL